MCVYIICVSFIFIFGILSFVYLCILLHMQTAVADLSEMSPAYPNPSPNKPSLFWIKPWHKPAMTANGNHTRLPRNLHFNGDDWGV